jgi:putative NADH-flavin reductase
MTLAILAATGGIGQQLVKQAVAAGHDVTAIARNPSKLNLPVRLVQANLASPDHRNLEQAVLGADAVLSGLGERTNADTGVELAQRCDQGARAPERGLRTSTGRRISGGTHKQVVRGAAVVQAARKETTT